MAVPLPEFAPRPDVAALAVGVFDGVHLGHQAIVARARDDAAIAGGGAIAAALTFEPHPRAVIAPERVPPRLTTSAQREILLRGSGAAEVLTVRFDGVLRELSAEQFLDELKRIFPALRRIAVGPGWHFGRERGGNASILAAYGENHGFAIDSVPAVLRGNRTVSSTRIREAIAARDFVEAAAMLGREYEVEGVIAPGDGRGSGIGFPTANIAGIAQLLPPPGVYACRATTGGVIRQAVANYGARPTFGPDGKPVLEVHLLDFSGDLYGAPIAVGAFRFLRDERKFESIDALKAQIADDARAARELAL
jgi:riboflavin kinase/FMN adenylyltransferase